MQDIGKLPRIFGILLFNDPRIGMRLMFLLIDIFGIITSIEVYKNKNIIKLENSEKPI